MKKSIKTLGLVLVILLAGATILPAQNGMGMANMRGQNFHRIPDLTDKQKTELNTLAEKQMTQMQTLRDEMQATTDIEKRGDIAKKMQILRDTHRQDVLSLLTDKQKEAFNANSNVRMGRGGRGPIPGNFQRRGPRGRMGYGNMNGNRNGRMPGRGMGYGYMNGRRM